MNEVKHRYYVVGDSDQGTSHWLTLSSNSPDNRLNLADINYARRELLKQAQLFRPNAKDVIITNIVHLGLMTDAEWKVDEYPKEENPPI